MEVIKGNLGKGSKTSFLLGTKFVEINE